MHVNWSRYNPFGKKLESFSFINKCYNSGNVPIDNEIENITMQFQSQSHEMYIENDCQSEGPLEKTMVNLMALLNHIKF